ncbi:ABC-type dipeptide/oligopeptide/nickel transport system ATPase component [Brooklawnia cerclae]|uniref:ABC-type dipeptide/oligopeptide/nickel transport system ATPase component n=1 Tax=Brooklawnia cerclae TaxID=349934 RepID=A0ABX0SI76_9ACTN|nr:ABC-type dipeptide/oligopeptide/nickel transport system ATPase component [Brooklawnia cerclae]
MSYIADGEPIPAVHGISFSLAPSERLAIVGESGSGKSTLATAVAGLIPWYVAEITCESARIGGVPVEMRAGRDVIPRRRKGVSMIFQDAMTSLDPVASIAHQFRTVLPAGHGTTRAQVRRTTLEWLAKVGIHEPDRVVKLHPHELSGGMRQRVMIALALCSAPKALIADEPTSALDASLSRRIMDLILELTEELGTALIIITHDVDLARTYTDRTLVLSHGEMQDLCATSELSSPERSAYTRALMRCVPRITDYDLDTLPTLMTSNPSHSIAEVIS